MRSSDNQTGFWSQLNESRKRPLQLMSPPPSPAGKRRAQAKALDFVELVTNQNIPVFTDTDPEYARSIAVANLLFRFAQPACVVHPRKTSDVEYIIKHAKRLDISVTVKNGGHAYSGSSTAYTGILIDMHLMDAVKLDMAAQTITVEGGALWGHSYKPLVDNHYDGYMINGGRCPGVGVAGFIMGGGIGPFTRSFGMGCDSLIQATIVTAGSGTVTVRSTDDPKSPKGLLFWALCGGGGGNFGVVVELVLGLEKLKNPTIVNTSGFVTTVLAPPRTQETRTVSVVRFIANYNGTAADFDKEIKAAIADESLTRLFGRRKIQEVSSLFLRESLNSQWQEEGRQVRPSSHTWSIYTSFVFGNDAATINGVTAIVAAELTMFRTLFHGDAAMCSVSFIHAGGQAMARPPDATAFPWRDAQYHAYIMMSWDEPEGKYVEAELRAFIRDFKRKLQPFSTLGAAAFVNFPDNTMDSRVHEYAYYGPNAAQLREVKELWDSDNFFNWPQAIRLPRPDQLKILDHVEELGEGRVGEEEEETEVVRKTAQDWENYRALPKEDFLGNPRTW